MVAAILVFVSLHAAAQTKRWRQDSYFTSGISFRSAVIKIDGRQVTYDELLKVEDTSPLKIEVYDKKTAVRLFGRKEGENGVVLVTTHTYKSPGYALVTISDSVRYFILDEDTVFCDCFSTTSFCEWYKLE